MTSSDDDMEILETKFDGVGLNSEPLPPTWSISFATGTDLPVTVVVLRAAQNCDGGHAVLSAVYSTTMYTQFFCDGVLTRKYNGCVEEFFFSHDPTGLDGWDYYSTGVALWPEGVYTHVFHPLLYKDIEEYWRYTSLPVL